MHSLIPFAIFALVGLEYIKWYQSLGYPFGQASIPKHISNTKQQNNPQTHSLTSS